jgi:hypothetical protein
MKRPIRAEHALALGYLGGVAGTLWDWREHYTGASNQAPHVLIDVSGLLIVAVLGLSGWRRYSAGARTAIYYLLVLVVLIALGPFVLMMAAPHSAFMAGFMRFVMTRGAVLLQGPFVVLAGWAAWYWLGLERITPARVAAAGGVVLVAVASVLDLYSHQTHPLEMGASTNMMTLPPHQLILAGFVIGVIGSIAALAPRPRLGTVRATVRNLEGRDGGDQPNRTLDSPEFPRDTP